MNLDSQNYRRRVLIVSQSVGFRCVLLSKFENDLFQFSKSFTAVGS